jgi:hypothetical protein
MSVCAIQDWGRECAVLTAFVVGLTLAGPVASAQTSVAVWEPASSGVERTPVDEEIPPDSTRSQRVPRRGLLTAGIAIMAVAYSGAVAWGSYFLADLQLGVPSCNDQYGGWHFLPVAGPLIGMLAGGECIPDSLHIEEAVMPVVFMVGQLVGLALLVAGAVGRVADMPVVNVTASADGALVQVGGSF